MLVFRLRQTHSTLRWGDAALEEEARGLRQPTEEQVRQMETWKAWRLGARP